MTEEIRITNQSLGIGVVLNRDNADYLLDDNEGIDWGEISQDGVLAEIIDGVGSEVLSTKVTTSRTITIVGWVINPNKEGKKKYLSQVLSPLSELTIQTGEFFITGQMSTAVKFATDYTNNNEEMCKFYLTIDCPNPFFIRNRTVLFGQDANLQNLGDTYAGIDLTLELLESASQILISMSHLGVTNSMSLIGQFSSGEVIHIVTIPNHKGIYRNSIKDFSILNLNSSWIRVPRTFGDEDYSRIEVSVDSNSDIRYQEMFNTLGDM